MTDSVKNMDSLRVGVIGAGSWGTALANVMAQKGFATELWALEPDVKEQMDTTHENKLFLAGVPLSEKIGVSNDLLTVAKDKDLLILVVPSHFMRSTAEKINDVIDPETIVVSASKGIENETFQTMTQILTDVLTQIPKERIAAISGPSFAKEVGLGIPTAITAASSSLDTAKFVQKAMNTPTFRMYAHDDPLGVELGGSIKNVIAIAAGIVDGLELGLNTRAALITRGLVEMRRLGAQMGANPRTLDSLAGIGDMILTCTGSLSRNHSVGEQIGQGKKLADILAGMHMVAEGVKTTKSVYELAQKMNVDMPICTSIYKTLYEDLDPKEAVYTLMTRSLKEELLDDA